MKLKSILFGFVSGIGIMIILPYILTVLNSSFNLPAYSSLTLRIIGFILFILGVSVFIYCSALFSKIGRGTPVPVEPPKKLVISGLYKFTRNPIYIGYFFIFLAEFFMFGHLLLLFYSVFIMLLIYIYIVYFEEPVLKKRFGNSYIEYTKKVPRWIFTFSKENNKT